ncbi:MAG: hypothetical protein N2117_06995 [Anaerolineales bacterium]|nr:hypothetical protein [Anaerolineales bacterium]MCX7754979.1 hypothetical protein [Anaerolineales bacterium]MDW8277357.1 hypothetical protein [Anaerolineales bacterium]
MRLKPLGHPSLALNVATFKGERTRFYHKVGQFSVKLLGAVPDFPAMQATE